MGKLTFSDVNIEVLGPDAALVRGKWEVKMEKETVGGWFTLRVPQAARRMEDHPRPHLEVTS